MILPRASTHLNRTLPRHAPCQYRRRPSSGRGPAEVRRGSNGRTCPHRLLPSPLSARSWYSIKRPRRGARLSCHCTHLASVDADHPAVEDLQRFVAGRMHERSDVDAQCRHDARLCTPLLPTASSRRTGRRPVTFRTLRPRCGVLRRRRRASTNPQFKIRLFGTAQQCFAATFTTTFPIGRIVKIGFI